VGSLLGLNPFSPTSRRQRFLLAPYGSAGDVYPFLWLGQELRRRGHEVVLVASPVFTEAARAVGLRLTPVGTREQFRALSSDPKYWHPLLGPWMVLGSARLWFTELESLYHRLIQPGRTTVLASAPNFAATLAARRTGTRLITVHLQPVAILSALQPPVFGWGWQWMRWLPVGVRRWAMRQPNPVDWMVGPMLRRGCRAAGLQPPRTIFTEWWDSPDGVLCLFPPWFAPPQPDWPQPHRQTDFPLFDPGLVSSADPDLENFLAAGPPPVLFTAGSAMGCPRDFFSAAVAACLHENCRGLLISAYPAELPPDLPPTVRAVSYASFARIFPRCEIIVHHGGIGTSAQALAAGVPQLIVPRSHDQPDNAERLQNLGCALTLPAWKVNGKRLAGVLRTLRSSPHYRAVAQNLASRLPPPGPATQAIDAVEEMLLTPPRAPLSTAASRAKRPG
jgi:rhamnosyltransferase subunit B